MKKDELKIEKPFSTSSAVGGGALGLASVGATIFKQKKEMDKYYLDGINKAFSTNFSNLKDAYKTLKINKLKTYSIIFKNLRPVKALSMVGAGALAGAGMSAFSRYRNANNLIEAAKSGKGIGNEKELELAKSYRAFNKIK